MFELYRSFIVQSQCRNRILPTLRNAHYNRQQRRLASFNTKTFQPNPKGPNQQLIRKLQKRYEDEGIEAQNAFKARSFLRAVKALDVYPEPIQTVSHVKVIDGIGEGIARRIDEILHPGSDPAVVKSGMKKDDVQEPEESEMQQAIKELTKVTGIGPVRARKLYDAGCRTVEDLYLPKHYATLSSPIKAAVKFVGLFEKPTLREQIEYLEKAILEVIPSDFEMHIVGNYRRKQPFSSGIDILLFHPSFVHIPPPADDPLKLSKAKTKASNPRQCLGRRSSNNNNRLSADAKTKQNELLSKSVIEPLEKQGLLAGTLTASPRRWQGFVRIPMDDQGEYQADEYERLTGIRDKAGEFARLDISLLPLPSKGAALLINTGDTDFNSFVRTTASRMGLQLNELGLWRWKEVLAKPPAGESVSPVPPASDVDSPNDDGNGTSKPSTACGYWELVASRSEEEVLEELGLEYVEPEKRNFSFVVGRSRRRKR